MFQAAVVFRVRLDLGKESTKLSTHAATGLPPGWFTRKDFTEEPVDPVFGGKVKNN